MQRERLSIASPLYVGSRVFVRRDGEPLRETVLASVRDVSDTSIALSCARLLQAGDVIVIQPDEFQYGRRPRFSAVITRVRPDRDRGYEVTCTVSARPPLNSFRRFSP